MSLPEPPGTAGTLGEVIIQRVGRWQVRRSRARVEALERLAVQAEGDMKRLAPWRNRTGAARARLHVRVINLAIYPNGWMQHVYMQFAHGVWYGKYLERRWSGKYAIVGPVFQAYLPRIRQVLRTVRG